MSAADSNGASDPYVVARYGGTAAKTAIRPVTTNPIWFQTLRLNAEILPLRIAPKVLALRDKWRLNLLGFVGLCLGVPLCGIDCVTCCSRASRSFCFVRCVVCERWS